MNENESDEEVPDDIQELDESLRLKVQGIISKNTWKQNRNRKQRRISNAQDFLSVIKFYFGGMYFMYVALNVLIPRAGSPSIPPELTMIKALEEAGVLNIEANKEEIVSLKHKHAQLQINLQMQASKIIYGLSTTAESYNNLRAIFKQLSYTIPTYKTVSSSFKSKYIPWNEDPETVVELLKFSDKKSIISILEYGGKRYYHISLSNRCIWILHLTIPLIKELYTHLTDCTLSLIGFFWYDGGKIGKTVNGLASGLKIAGVSLKNSDNERLVLPKYITRSLISYCWILNCRSIKENGDNVKHLESMLLEQNDFLKNSSIQNEGFKLNVSIIGCASDHGIRSKLLWRDDNSESRCGECTYIFIKTSPYRFLNWAHLIKCERINKTNFVQHRNMPMTSLLERSCDLSELGLMTYDNLHNFGGHLKDLVPLLISLVPKSDRKFVAEKISEYTGIRTSTILNAPDSFFYFKGYHWRKLSLHLHDIFIPLCKPKFKNSLSALFDILTEIHLFNYIHWDRDDDNFEILRLRYCMLLFMYALQLRDVFSDIEIQELDTLYLHKLFIHSLKVFIYVNLAGCSCEGGEGMISIMKHLFRFKNRTVDAAFGTVLVRLMFKEDAKFKLASKENFSDSIVFTDDFINNYNPKPIKVHLIGDTMLVFKDFLKYCGFEDNFIQTHCDTKYRKRTSYETKNYYFKDQIDARVMKSQLLQSRIKFTTLDELRRQQNGNNLKNLEYSINKDDMLSTSFVYTRLFMAAQLDPENFTKTYPLFEREKIFKETNEEVPVTTDEQKQLDKIQRFTLKINNLLNCLDVLNAIQEHIETIEVYLDNDEKEAIPQSYLCLELDGNLAEGIEFLREEKWKDQFAASSAKNEFKKKFSYGKLFQPFFFFLHIFSNDNFSIDLFGAFKDKYNYCFNIISRAHIFYSKINQRIMDYCTLEFVVEDKPLADKLIAHCAAFKIANRKFEIEFKRAAKFFYSVFFFIYVNPTLIDHLPNSPFLKDIFNDFTVSKDKFGEQYVVDVDKWSNCVIDEEEEEEEYEEDCEENSEDSEDFDDQIDISNYDAMDIETESRVSNKRTRQSIRIQQQSVPLIKTQSQFCDSLKSYFRANKYNAQQLSKIYNTISSLINREFILLRETDDGHCGFRSIANQIHLLTGDNLDHIEVRKAALTRFMNVTVENGIKELLFTQQFVASFVTKHLQAIDNGKEEPTPYWMDDYMLAEITYTQKVNINIVEVSERLESNEIDVHTYSMNYEGTDCVGTCNIISWQNHFDSILCKPPDGNLTRLQTILYRASHTQYSSL